VREGGDGFLDVDLPVTALVLAQGAGRLVRGHADRGVVAVLDRRLATARYRDVLLDALPPMRRVVDGNVAREFLAAASGGEPSTTTLSGPLPDALQEGSDEA
jgi:ATP-dependent DNA helicase DinG